MRWDDLFDDLESQLEQGIDAEELDLRAQEERLRIARATLRDRLVAIRSSHSRSDEYRVRIVLDDGSIVAVRPVAIGKDWMSADLVDGSAARRQCIVPLASIGSLLLDPPLVRASLADAPAEEPLAARLGLAFALRDLGRRRVTVELETTTGPVVGTIDRVARDHLDLAVHEAGTPRRASVVAVHRVVPLSRLLLVRL
ncbi:hypothetical protein QT381_06730 [Galbitalea sp. SE-J8]|uniref:hypothetical protein n=1 Tax=Galbitalea sp. SE-J8 TaxID=3054952 RepID=UPI00259C89AD|nr:hypothetical protein [Galbitalea sp. SE-J8]MDM4762698.1 hypothetical protein [Galbitalea sp. SE-J8]